MQGRLDAISQLTDLRADDRFFEKAGEAIAQGIGANIVGICKLDMQTKDRVEMLSLVIDGKAYDLMCFKLEGTPAQELYSGRVGNFLTLDADAFATFESRSQHGLLDITKYWGQALKNCDGENIGHCFVMWRDPPDLTGDDEGFFRLTSNLIAAEIERLASVQALKKGRERYDLAVSQAGVWDWDLETDSFFYSPRFREMLGYTEGEFSGVTMTTLPEFIHEADRHAYSEALSDHLANPTTDFNREVRLKTKNRGYRWYHVGGRCKTDAAGAPIRFAGLATEIEVRKRTEAALIDSQRRLTEAQRMANVSSWLTDEECIEASWHEPSGAMFGTRESIDITWETFLANIHPLEAVEFRKALRNCVSEGHEFEFVHRYWTPEGEVLWLHQRGEPVFDDKGRVAAVKGSSVDVTRLKRAQEQLVMAKEEAEYANRAKSEFLANMSHELRTPLNAVIGFGSLLSQEVFGTHAEPRYKEYAEDICNSGQHLLDLINDILDVSRIEAGSIDLDDEKVSVHDINEASIKLVAPRADKNRIKITTTVEPADLELMADMRRIKQILINLLSNAVKFTPADGRVDVSWRVTPESVVLEVQDTGVGIEPHVLPRLFEPFSRGEDSMTREYEGTGLGLSLVRMLAEEHGGTARIESTVGVGTKVTVLLPARRVITSIPVYSGNEQGPEKDDDGGLYLKTAV